jgi:ATP-dependent Clp protease ATP-binding subunit ClpX
MKKKFDDDLDENIFGGDDFTVEDIHFDDPPSDEEKLREYVDLIPILSPQKIWQELELLGYKGQDEQRKALSLMAYRHVRRLKKIYLEGEDRKNLPPKQNVLMLGPTGCGKTYLVELLFQNIFKLPTLIVDITSFTESGYVGDSVNTILTRLISKTDDDPLFTTCGVICLDEFDKLASSGSSARFAGQGTTKDVSGYGVQRELLAMIQGTNVSVPMDYGFSEYGYRSEISTSDIPFIACGAFSGFEELLKESRSNIGFRQDGKTDDEILTEQEAQSFQKFGFLPELIGRFSRIIPFSALTEETLRQILTENILPQFVNEFSAENLKLTATSEALKFIVQRCEKRGTGARGLHTELVTTVEKIAFETFGETTNAEVIIKVKNERLVTEIV